MLITIYIGVEVFFKIWGVNTKLNRYVIPTMKNGINVCKKDPKSKVMSYSPVEDSERSVPGDLLALGGNVFDCLLHGTTD